MVKQDQVLRRNNIKSKLDSVSPLCRLCRESEETISHLLTECTMLAQQYRLWRYERVSVVADWVMCNQYGFPTGSKWYEHTQDSAMKVTVQRYYGISLLNPTINWNKTKHTS